MLGFMATQKIGLHAKVTEFNLENYPRINIKLLIEKKYKINIDGYYKNKQFDLGYTLTSKWIESDAYKIKSDLNITGKIKGPRKELSITGQGKALDGNISYRGIKHRHSFNDVHIEIKDINSSKLFKLLGQKPILGARANGYLDFEIISHEERKGILYYSAKDVDYHGVKIDLNAQVEVNDAQYDFTLEVKAPTASLHLLQGKYNQEKNQASAVYVLDIKNVSDIKKLVKINYDAPFYALGKLKLDHKKLTMQGFSESLGGVVDLALKENKLYFHLHDIPLSPLMKKLDVEAVFDTDITGTGVYDIKDKTILLHSTLSALSFKQSKLSKSILKSSDIDLSKEVFNNNHLHLETIDGELSSTLLLANKKNHLHFKDTRSNSKNHSVKTNIDLNMYQYSMQGKLYFKIDKYTAANDTYINFDGLVQKYYALKLQGLVNTKWTSMDYALSSARLPSHICTIVDDVNVTGHINGPFKRLHIDGKGTALDGNVTFKAVQVRDHLEEVYIHIQNIHALKLATLLGYPELPYGKGDLRADFKHLSQSKQKGNIHYTLTNAKLFNLPLTIDTKVKFKSQKQEFKADITLANAKIKLSNGINDRDTGKSEAFYTLDVANLASFEELLGYKYKGAFHAVGTAKYDGDYQLHGLSKTFDGLTEFDYRKATLKIDLSNVSFQRIMSLFPHPTILDANTTGKIHYDFNKEKLLVNTKLKNAKFSYHETMDTIYRKSGINILKEVFTDSSLDVKYQNEMIFGNLIMENKTSHLSLTNTQINTKLNTINAFFDVKIQEKEFTGKIYGSLDDPKINLNMQKLIRHEMDKQLDSFMGEGNRKLMENMPMGNTAKDMASGVGGAFMGMFF